MLKQAEADNPLISFCLYTLTIQDMLRISCQIFSGSPVKTTIRNNFYYKRDIRTEIILYFFEKICEYFLELFLANSLCKSTAFSVF